MNDDTGEAWISCDDFDYNQERAKKELKKYYYGLARYIQFRTGVTLTPLEDPDDDCDPPIIVEDKP